MARSQESGRCAAVLGTLDTKSQEIGLVASELEAAGVRALVVDVGVKGRPGLQAHVTREEVAGAAGQDLAQLAGGSVPAADALKAMGRGAGLLLAGMASSGKIQGAIGLGGGRGTAVVSAALRGLPYGFPKLAVSTAASGETRRFLGTRDIMIVSPVTDLLGLNVINRAVLQNAAAAMAGMVLRYPGDVARQGLGADAKGTRVGITSIGVTSKAVEQCSELLRGEGAEVLAFHARGPGGEALEQLVRDGLISAVIDLSLTEMMNELVGGISGAGPHRLEAAGEMGVPQVVLPGGIDFINYGPPATVPAQFSGRRFYRHSESATLMRSDPQENARLGELVGTKLNRSRGPVAVIIPEGGFSAYDVPGGVFWWPEADRAFIDALVGTLGPTVRVERMAEDVNSPAVAERAVRLLQKTMRGE